jgi:hypothetical protein
MLTNNVAAEHAEASVDVAQDVLDILTLRPNLTPSVAMRALCITLGAVIAASRKVGGFEPEDDLIIRTIRTVEERAVAVLPNAPSDDMPF